MASPDSQAALLAQRKKDKSLTWQPYLTSDGKQDLQELWERLDLDRKGFITYQELHAAVNEAAGRPVSSAALQPLACRMDATTRQGRRITHADFTEYMAQQLLGDQRYQEALRAEQGPLLKEVGYKLYELLKIYKRKQMLKDAMGGSDGIKRLLTLTQVPVQRRPRRRGQVGFGLLGSPTHGGSPGSASPSNLHSPSRRRGGDLSAGHSPMMALAAGAGGGGGGQPLRSKSFAFGSPVATGTGVGAQGHANAGHGGVQLVPSSPPLGAAAAAAAAAGGDAGRSPSLTPRLGLGDVPAGFVQPTSGEWPGPEVEARLASGAGRGDAGAADPLFQHCHVMSHEDVEAAAVRARQRREMRVAAEVGGASHVFTVCSLDQQPAHTHSPPPSSSSRPASAAGWLHGGKSGSPGGSSPRSPVRRPGTACAALRTVSTAAVFGGHDRTPQAAAVAAGVGAARVAAVAAVRRSASPAPGAGAASSPGPVTSGSTGLGSPVVGAGHGHNTLRRAGGIEAAVTAAAAAAAAAEGGGGAATIAVTSCASSAALSAPYGHYGGYAGGGNGGAGPLWRSNGLLGEVLHSLDRAGLAALDRGLQEQAALQAAAGALVEPPTAAPAAAEASSAAAALASVLMASASPGSPPALFAAQQGQQAWHLSRSLSSRAGPAVGSGGAGAGGGGAYGGPGGGGGAVPARPHTSMAVYGPGCGASAARQAYHSTFVAPATPAGGAFQGGDEYREGEEDVGPGDGIVAGWWGEVVSTSHLARQSGASPAAQGGPHASSPAGSIGSGSGPGQRVPRAAPNFMSGTASAKAMYLDVSDSVEDDPLLAQLPNWIRKGIGLPPATQPPPRRPGAWPSAAGAPVPDPAAPPDDFQLAHSGSGLDVDISEVLPGSCGSDGGSSSQTQLLRSAPGSGSVPEGGAVPGPGQEPGAGDTDAVATARLAALSGRSSRLNMQRYVPFGGDADAVVEEAADEGEASSPKHARGGGAAVNVFAVAFAPPEAAELGLGPAPGSPPPPPPVAEVTSPGQGPVVVMLAPLPRSRPGSPVRSGSPGVQRPRSRPGSASRFSPILGEPAPIIMVGPPPLPPAQDDTATAPGCRHGGADADDDEAAVAGTGGAGYLSSVGGLSFGAGLGGGGGGSGSLADKGARTATPESLAAWEASVVSQRGSAGHGALRGDPDDAGALGDELAAEEEEELLAAQLGGLWSGRPGSGRAGSPQPHRLSQVIPDPLAPAAGSDATGALGSGGGRPGSASPHSQQAHAAEVGPRGRGPVVFRVAGAPHAGARGVAGAGAGGPHDADGCAGNADAGGDGTAAAARNSASRASSLPPFISGQRPASPGGLPLAFQVVAAAEAAVAEEEAEGRRSAAAGAAAWVLGDAAVSSAAAPGSPAAVRLNRTALLRLSSQYGVELAEVAAAALGLSCTSPAAQAAVAQQLLCALSAGQLGGRASGGGAGGGGSCQRRRSGSPSPPARSPHGGAAPAVVQPAVGRMRPRSAAAAVGSSAAQHRQQSQQPQAQRQLHGGMYSLPAEALAASRRLRLGAEFVSRVSPHTHEAAAYHMTSPPTATAAAAATAAEGAAAQPARPKSAAGHTSNGKAGTWKQGVGQDPGANSRPRSALALAPPPRSAPSINNTRTQRQLQGAEVASLLRATAIPLGFGSGPPSGGGAVAGGGGTARGFAGVPSPGGSGAIRRSGGGAGGRQAVEGGGTSRIALAGASTGAGPAVVARRVAFAQSAAGVDSTKRG
ncbi:hypothetical protein HXX76_002799 [Chlamydomonas incerta]|uniref:EF-hand domain-containing protein n=1 Tax=Chlamydomonas incerta TaxID=51695 RepID=A0A835TP99_CHLIN|nr:hypothetical protein HXX76_002799 [Chlamydomonas incerta]|eukprot:KAG2442716.1 hypothetical protein HXX76_002799 [Chlamydomonas incerta]